MRAIVLLCLLHTAFGKFKYTWDGPVRTTQPADPDISNVCLTDQASCGCCLMKKHMERMELFFDQLAEAQNKEVTELRTALDNMRASRSAFSVALTTATNFGCYGPFDADSVIVYKHVFFNLGNYNLTTGIFTVPRSGVYSLTATLYAANTPGNSLASCANLQVNNQAVAMLLERNGQDAEDSTTVVVAQKLRAGDQVSVNLLTGCVICDDNSHFNTFTGFLVYTTD